MLSKLFLLTVVITLMTAMTYFFLKKEQFFNVASDEKPLADEHRQLTGAEIPNIEEIAEFNILLASTVRSGNWAHEHLEKIAKLWRNFSDGQRNEIRQYGIFEQFNDAISGQILVQRTRSQRNDIVAIYQERALIAVANVLGIEYKKQSPDALEKAEASLASAAAVRAKQATADASKTPKEKIELEIKSIKEQKLILEQLETAKVNETGSGSGTPVSTITSSAGSPSNTTHSVNGKQTQQSAANQLSRADADKLMKNFVAAYKTGDLKMLQNLFLSSSGASAADDMNATYQNLFQQTRNRDLEFKTASWTLDKNTLAGNINYTLSMQSKKNNQVMREIGNVDVIVDQHNGEPKIARLRFKNSITESFEPTEKVASATGSGKSKNHSVGENELKKLISNFTAAYNKGDIDTFMSLFASDARADDKDTIAGIRKDYTQLFSSTRIRQMNIDRLHWNVSGNKVKVQGKIIVTIKASEDSPVNTVSGEINMELEKSGDQLKIKGIQHDV